MLNFLLFQVSTSSGIVLNPEATVFQLPTTDNTQSIPAATPLVTKGADEGGIISPDHGECLTEAPPPINGYNYDPSKYLIFFLILYLQKSVHICIKYLRLYLK